jgi:phage baseplate assembly protein W
MTTSNYKWTGLGIPLTTGPEGNLSPKKTPDLIKSSIYEILTTRIGTRLMRPSFGSIFLELLFEPNDNVLLSKIRTFIPAAIKRWEPRIDKVSISAVSSGKDLKITISGIVVETGERIDSYLVFQKNQNNS